MARKLLYPVNFIDPASGEQVTFAPGSTVPDWAERILDAHPAYYVVVDEPTPREGVLFVEPTREG
ncbi:MAG: hypothetical protein M3P83_09315 [Actinomycetota bacterium]|nr:hypothetical protein [Actinomycetota bacterium]